MHLAWIDNRTLVVCQCILASVFSLVLFCIWKLYPQLRGVGSIGLGFSLGIPAALLFALRGHISPFLSILVANLCIFTLYLLLYRGVLQFCQTRGHMRWLASLVCVALGVVSYYTLVEPKIMPRIVVISLTIGVARAMLAYEIFRASAGRRHMTFFALSLALFALSSFASAIVTPIQARPGDFLANDGPQSMHLLVGILFICIDGMFYLTMLIQEVTATIEHQAQLDFLTGTLNRRGIEEALAVEIARTRRSYRPIAVLLLDIDHFKSINDAEGHAAGDEALRLVTRSIATVLRVYDRLGRFGGDEFLLLLPETTGEHGLIIAERIRESLATLFAAMRKPPLTLSIGVTHFVTGEEPIDIIARADAALYQAKRDGRNCARLQAPYQSADAPTRPFINLARTSLLSRVAARRRLGRR